jgi:hypothetical protein
MVPFAILIGGGAAVSAAGGTMVPCAIQIGGGAAVSTAGGVEPTPFTVVDGGGAVVDANGGAETAPFAVLAGGGDSSFISTLYEPSGKLCTVNNSSPWNRYQCRSTEREMSTSHVVHSSDITSPKRVSSDSPLENFGVTADHHSQKAAVRSGVSLSAQILTLGHITSRDMTGYDSYPRSKEEDDGLNIYHYWRFR